MNSDTIVAPATPYGIGGIAVVRLSGPQSLSIVYKLINNNELGVGLVPRRATLTRVFDLHGGVIDESLLVYFKSPSSYTGEDLIEISCHGSPIIVDKIVASCCSHGARIAEPGEFTKRAFINGKMDLVQAESVASLIHSQSEEGSRLNLRLLEGELSNKLNNIRKGLLDATSLVEFELDISEDGLQPNLCKQVKQIADKQSRIVKELLDSYKQARMLNRGALVVIGGAPNVGKSTLLNTLSKTSRAITSDIPGTTRDAIDVSLILDGVPINLVDTAGLRETTELLEAEGVRRSIDYMRKADLILLVHDLKQTTKTTTNFYKSIPVIKLVNKVDLLNESEMDSIHDKFKKMVFISAKTGFNIDKLKQSIKTALGISSSISDIVSITTSRQLYALIQCNENLFKALELLSGPRIAYELVSIELREALDSLGEILGKTTPDDILTNIFNKFCVGK